jgi:hypothetical protein
MARNPVIQADQKEKPNFCKQYKERRKAPINDGKKGDRCQAEHGVGGGGGGKAWSLLSTQVNRDWARGKWQTSEKSAYPRSPAACCPGNREHQQRSKQEFNQEQLHLLLEIASQ